MKRQRWISTALLTLGVFVMAPVLPMVFAHDDGDRDEDVCKLDLKEMVAKNENWGTGKGQCSIRVENKVTSNHDLVEFDSIGLVKIVIEGKVYSVRFNFAKGTKSIPGPVDTVVAISDRIDEEPLEASFKKLKELKDVNVQISEFTVSYIARIKCFALGGIKGGQTEGKTEKGTDAKKSGVFMSGGTEIQSATEDFEATAEDLELLKP